jgi:signal transduction histidine kinase
VLAHEKFDPIRGVVRTPGVGARLEPGRVRTSEDAPARDLAPAAEPSSTPEGRRRLLMGRLAGVLFLASSGLMLIALPLSTAEASIAGTVAVAASGAAVGCFAMFAPWDAWPRVTSLILVPPAFALIAFGNLYGGREHTYGVFFVVAFVWIGLAHGPWTSLAVAPLAIVAYLVPFVFLPGDVEAGVSSVAVTIPACIMVGEVLSWGSTRLARTEKELRHERETAQGLKELADMKTAFMSAVSHELRTPITICRGHLEVLEPDADRLEIGETIALVLDELDRMNRLVDDMTTAVRGDDPSFLRREPVQLATLVSRVARKVEPLLSPRLRVAPVPRDARLHADPRRLEQALVNLLQNAAVHTPDETPVELRVSQARRAWLFEVEDRGPGLARGQDEEAFERFVHGPASSGSGLGLAVVRSIARGHGGEAGVDNHPGKGATFWILIPR